MECLVINCCWDCLASSACQCALTTGGASRCGTRWVHPGPAGACSLGLSWTLQHGTCMSRAPQPACICLQHESMRLPHARCSDWSRRTRQVSSMSKCWGSKRIHDPQPSLAGWFPSDAPFLGLHSKRLWPMMRKINSSCRSPHSRSVPSSVLASTAHAALMQQICWQNLHEVCTTHRQRMHAYTHK